jgi:hypothetical protein
MANPSAEINKTAPILRPLNRLSNSAAITPFLQQF